MSKTSKINGNSEKIPEILVSSCESQNDLKHEKAEESIETCLFTKLCFSLLGMCTIMSMAFFITANEYWMYKFRNVTLESTGAGNRTVLQVNFTSSFGLVASIPTVIFTFISTFVGHQFKSGPKIFIFLSTISVILALHGLFVMINTDTWQTGFFVLSMVSGGIMAVAGALGNVGIYAIIGKFPAECMHFLLLGQGAADVVAATLRIITLTVVTDFKASAVLYFATGAALYSLGILWFYMITKQKYYKFHHIDVEDESKKAIKSPVEVFSVFKDVWIIILILAIIVLLPVHPSVTSLVVSQYTGTSWGDTYFVTVVTYLFSGVCSILGRLAASSSKKALHLKPIFAITLIRSTIFPILICLCNVQPKHHVPTVFTQDWQYALLLSLYMFLTGYLQNVTMLLTPIFVSKEKVELAYTLILLCFFTMMACMSPVSVLVVNLI